tara:strand:+ start:2019 stop:2429 length:411 start_codon:yes stop_codon:yes gene_type:complete
LEEKLKKTFNGLVMESRDALDIIDSTKLNDMIEKNEDMVIIDVNDKEEVDQRGMIEGAINVSLGTLYYKADNEVPENFKDSRIQDREKKVVVTCGLGLCAAIGGKLLKDMGFKNVSLLEGGVTKWQEDGFKLKKQS